MGERRRRTPSGRRRALRLVLALLVFAAIAALLYLTLDEQGPRDAGPPVAESTRDPSPAVTPRYPIPEPPQDAVADESAAPALPGQPLLQAQEDAALPPLNASDAQVGEALAQLYDEQALNRLFNRDELLRRFAMTVETLPGGKLPRRELLVVKRAPGSFRVEGEGEALHIAPDNAQRYAPYVDLLTGVDAGRAAAVYLHFYPLVQEAYRELGYPDAYFNDRLVAVIDHLLETPRVEEPIRLVQPHVFYEYADPQLEALSGGQKALLRMGSANAERVKAWLRELRAAVTRADAD